MDIADTALLVTVGGLQGLGILWVYRVWNRRHYDIKEALACIDDLHARVRALEAGDRDG